MTPQEILAKMTPGKLIKKPSSYSITYDGIFAVGKENNATPVAVFPNEADAEAHALLHSDHLVKQRRGWWTEIGDDGEWYVPELWVMIVNLRKKTKEAIDACTQTGTDLGLLTKAEQWAIKEGLVEA